MSWGVVFMLPVIAFPVVFFSTTGIIEHRQNLAVRHSPNSVEALRRRARQQQMPDSSARSTEP